MVELCEWRLHHHCYAITDSMELMWLHCDKNRGWLSHVLIYVNAIVTIRKHFPSSHAATNILRHCKSSAEDVHFSKSPKCSAKPVELRHGIRLRDAAVSRSAVVGHPVLPCVVVYVLASTIKGRAPRKCSAVTSKRIGSRSMFEIN